MRLNKKKMEMFLFLSFSSLIASILVMGRSTTVTASPATTISVSPEAISDLEPGETFALDITATDVSDWGNGLWGYEFTLSYDTNVLTASAYSSYDPFSYQWASELNDTAGYVTISYSMPLGTKEGMTGDVPLAKIDFTVDAFGASVLDLHGTQLAAAQVVDGLTTEIEHVVVDSSFANVGEKMAVSPNFATAWVNETSYIEITLGETATEVWSYYFNLTYDPEILTVTSVASSAIFSTELFSEINNTLGYVVMNYSIAGGEGFSTLEPKPIARIEFTVDDVGRSPLKLTDTEIKGKEGKLPHQIIHGSFSNYRDIAVVDISASPIKLLSGGIVMINVTVQNQGDFPETFNVTLRYADITIGTKTDILLDPGASETLAFTWNTIGAPSGVYTLRAKATLITDAKPLNNISASVNIILGESQMMGVTLLYGLAIGTGVVVGATAVIYSRKAKTRTRVKW